MNNHFQSFNPQRRVHTFNLSKVYFLGLLFVGFSLSSLLYPTQCLSKEQNTAKLDTQKLTPHAIAQCARQDNPALRIALSQLEQAKSQVSLAENSFLPSLNIDSILAPLPARRLLKYCVNPASINGDGLSSVVVCPNQDIQDDARLSDVDGMGVFTRTTATLTLPLITFGKLSNGKKAALSGFSAYQSLSKVAKHQFDQLAFQAFYGFILTHRAQRVFRKAERYLKKIRKRIEKSLKDETGQYTSNDLSKLSIKEVELNIAATDVHAQRQTAIQGIQLSCKLEANTKLKTQSNKLKMLKTEIETKEIYLAKALKQRAEMQAARQQILAREALRAQALSNFFPNIALIGTFGFARGTSAEDNPDPFANDPFNVLGYGAYLGLSWRLNFAQLGSRLQASEANLAKAKAELYGLEQQITLEVNQQYQELVRRRDTLKLRDQARIRAKKWVTSVMLKKDIGLLGLQASLEPINAYLKTSLDYDRDVYEYNLALTRMWSLSGDDPLTLLPK